MRKITTTILALGMIAMIGFGCVACGGIKQKEPEKDQTETTTATEEDPQVEISSEFKQLMMNVMEKDAKDVAKDLENFVYENGEDINFQSLSALAAENAQTMLEENADLDYFSSYSLKMEAIVSQCLEDDEDLETDVAFNQVVNAMNEAIENIHKDMESTAEESTEEAIDSSAAKEFEQLMNDVMDKDTDEAAQELEDFTIKYADKVNAQNLTRLAQENAQKMLDTNDGSSYAQAYLSKIEAVTDKCYENNPDLETDVTFNQVVNAITDAVADM